MNKLEREYMAYTRKLLDTINRLTTELARVNEKLRACEKARKKP